MKATIVRLSLLLIHLQAVETVLTRIKLQPAPRIDVEKELARIYKLCVTEEDRLELSSNVKLAPLAYVFTVTRALESGVETICLQELRSTLHFSPPGPWKPHNKTSPNEQELNDAPTLEAYYELREPRQRDRSTDSRWVSKKNMDDVMKYLDENQPTIRRIFKQTFEEKLVKEGSTITRETVDAMLQEYKNIVKKVDRAVYSMVIVNNCPPEQTENQSEEEIVDVSGSSKKDKKVKEDKKYRKTKKA